MISWLYCCVFNSVAMLPQSSIDIRSVFIVALILLVVFAVCCCSCLVGPIVYLIYDLLFVWMSSDPFVFIWLCFV